MRLLARIEKKNTRTLGNSKVYYCVQKASLLGLVLIQINPKNLSTSKPLLQLFVTCLFFTVNCQSVAQPPCQNTTTFPPSETDYSYVCSYHKHPKAVASVGNLRPLDTVVTGPERTRPNYKKTLLYPPQAQRPSHLTFLADETDQNVAHERQTDHTEAVFSYSGTARWYSESNSYIFFWTQLITGVIRLEQICIFAVLCR